MRADRRFFVTPEWLDWFQKLWYQRGITDERIRRLTEDLNKERREQVARAEQETQPRRSFWSFMKKFF